MCIVLPLINDYRSLKLTNSFYTNDVVSSCISATFLLRSWFPNG
jgi:hypothetical protein